MKQPSSALSRAVEIAGSQAALARSLGVTPPVVNQWVKGERPVPIQACVLIEKVTDKAVTRQELRPADWHLIWPELVEQGVAHG